MTTIDKQICDAFDDVTLPESVRENTLAAIAALEKAEGSQTVTAPTSPKPVSKRMAMARAKRWVVAAAACLALCLVGFGGYSGFTAETAQVDIDVNPSLELGLNTFDRVVAVRPLNDDATDLLQGVDLWGKTYDEAMEVVSSQQDFDTYVTQDSYMQISVVCDNDSQQQSLQASSKRYLQSLPCQGSCESATSQQYHEAQEAGMGVGRYEAAQRLMALDGTVTLDDCKNMSMRQLRDAIEQCEPGASEGLGHHRQRAHGEGA